MDRIQDDIRLQIRKSPRRILKNYLFAAQVCSLGLVGYVTDRFEDTFPLPVIWLLLFGGAALLALLGASISHWLTRNFTVELKADRVDVRGGWRAAVWTFDRFCGPAWLEWDNQGAYYILKFRYFVEPRSAQAPPGSANERTRVGKIVLAYVPTEDCRLLASRLNERSEEWRVHLRRAAYEARTSGRKA